MTHIDGWPTTRITLLAQIRDATDECAWRAFVDLYAPVVYTYCRRHSMQTADAENVAQEVFSRVSRSIGSFDYDTSRGRFRGWLGLITHQQMIRYKARQSRSSQKLFERPHDDLRSSFEGEAEAAWIDVFNAHVLECALDNLRPELAAEEWQAFEQVWQERIAPGEVARAMQKEPQWVYQVKHKIVGRLKEEIERLTADAAVLHRN